MGYFHWIVVKTLESEIIHKIFNQNLGIKPKDGYYMRDYFCVFILFILAMLRPNCDRQAPALVVVQGVSCPAACGILVPLPGMETRPPHWKATREVPVWLLKKLISFYRGFCNKHT